MKKTVFHSRLLGLLLIVVLAASACNLRQNAGTVKGVVYADQNGNGAVDPGEGPLPGVTVTLDGCGASQTQTTSGSGAFEFRGLTPGTCTISASMADWAVTGSSPSAGNPIQVTAAAGETVGLTIDLAPKSALVPTATPTPEDTPTPEFTATSSEPPTETFTNTPSTPMVEVVDKTANCRFGPSLDYLPVGTMPPGQWVPIDASTGDQTWWRIQLPTNPTIYCWIGASISQTAGDLSQVQVVEAPAGLAIGVSIHVPSLLHGSCSGSNTNNFTGAITTNGPGEVMYHWEVDNSTGLVMNTSSARSLIFHSATTLAVDNWSFTGGCGNYVVRLLVTDPNPKNASAPYQVEP